MKIKLGDIIGAALGTVIVLTMALGVAGGIMAAHDAFTVCPCSCTSCDCAAPIQSAKS